METSITISTDLVKNINELLGGAKIIKVDTQAEYDRCIDLHDKAKACKADLETEYERKFMPRVRALDKERDDVWNVKKVPLIALIKNLANVSGAWQIEQKRLEDERLRIEEQKAEDERKRLAKIENDRLVEEQRLRDEAAAKLAEAETKTGAERDKLIEQANTCAEVADIAVQEAGQAAQAAQDVKVVEPVRTFSTGGFKAKVEFYATVHDVRQTIKWLVNNGEWGYLEGAKLNDLANSAANAIAKKKANKDFKLPGASILTRAGGR